MKPSRALALLTVLIGAVGVVHCSLITSLDGLTGSSDASSNDETSEAAVPDAGSDDGSDGAPSDGAGPDTGPFCIYQDAFFCADFDEDGGLGSGWSTLISDDAGVSVLDPDSISAPNAYLSLTGPAATASDSHHSYLVENFVNLPTRVIVSFDMRIDHFSSNTIAVETVSLLVSGALPNTGYSIQLNVDSFGSRITEQIPIDAGTSTIVDRPLSQAILLGVWSHVTIDAVFSGTRSLTVSLDGAVVLDHAALAPNANPGPLHLLLGTIFAKGPSDGFVARFDNVLIDTLDGG